MASEHEVIEVEGSTETPLADVDMAGVEGDENGKPEEKPVKDSLPSRIDFVDYLKSPIITIVVGSGEDQMQLTAHRALLEQSPYLQDQLGVGGKQQATSINLQDEQLDAVGSLLEYLYTGEYFPRKMGDSRTLEPDPANPSGLDEDGKSLLKHARVYTLAQKLGLSELKTLAHSKIHRINSTAKGEIAYARFVYGNTPAADEIIRKPVAAFWAHRSHVLRHEAETEFREMCLAFPEFGFDVLNLVLDQKERGKEKEHPVDRISRKRHRSSAQVTYAVLA